jgi:drug/metabolite transporter (DMT)-like permease
MVTFCFLLASQAVFIRRVSADIHPFEIVLFRNVFALLFLAPVYWHFGIEGMRTRAWGLYALAFILMGISPLAWFLAIALMPIAEMIALTFTSPLFGTIGGALILGEVVRWRRWAAIAAGFVGAMIILRPGIAAVSPPALLALLASVFIASSALTLRKLSATENPTAIVLWASLVITPISAVPAAFVWTMPSLASLGWMVGLGLVSLLAHVAWVRSFAAADVSAVMPFNFTKLLFAALFGYLFFAEKPDAWMWVGAAIIFAATLYTGHREATAKVEASAAGPRGGGTER